MDPKRTIRQFDLYLLNCGLELEAILVGGSALVLLGVVSRHTHDCDVLDPEIPQAVAVAANAFAEHRRGQGDEIEDGWFNNGPSSLVAELPPGWRGRLQLAFEGQALRLTALGRADLLKTKLFAYCDRGRDQHDCIALAPTESELVEAEPWVVQRDGHAGWPAPVKAQLIELREKMTHG